MQFKDFFYMDPDPDFWPIRTQEKSSIRIRKNPDP